MVHHETFGLRIADTPDDGAERVAPGSYIKALAEQSRAANRIAGLRERFGIFDPTKGNDAFDVPDEPRKEAVYGNVFDDSLNMFGTPDTNTAERPAQKQIW